MQLKFCIAVNGCDAKILKSRMVQLLSPFYLFIYLFIYLSHLKLSTAFLIAEKAFCHSVTIPFNRPKPDPAAAQPAGRIFTLIYLLNRFLHALTFKMLKKLRPT
jgi:hypothetical protein